jgi:hypothetical protein
VDLLKEMSQQKKSDVELERKITRICANLLQESNKKYEELLAFKDKYEASKNASKGMSSPNSSLQPQYSSNMSSFNNVIHKVKLDILKFDGEDNREGTRWINKVENYFSMHHISDDDDKINIASMYLEKTTCDWFLWWDSKCRGGLVRDWDTFKKIFFKRFQDIEEDELFTKLTRLQQTGTMDEFFNEIHVLATHVDDVSDKCLLQIAIIGLKPNIHNKIKVLDIKDVESVHQKAKLIEAIKFKVYSSSPKDLIIICKEG